MDYILKFINTSPYLVLFIGSTIDHSGIPFFTILAGVLFASSTIDLIPAVSAIIFAYLINDLIFILLGRLYFKKRIETYKNNLFKTIDVSILEKGLSLYMKSKNTFYYFSKIIPGVGKYAPILTGIEDKNLKVSLLKYMVGNILYYILFFVPSIYIGEQLKRNSKIYGIVLLIAFIGIYKVFEYFAKKKIANETKSI